MEPLEPPKVAALFRFHPFRRAAGGQSAEAKILRYGVQQFQSAETFTSELLRSYGATVNPPLFVSDVSAGASGGSVWRVAEQNSKP